MEQTRDQASLVQRLQEELTQKNEVIREALTAHQNELLQKNEEILQKNKELQELVHKDREYQTDLEAKDHIIEQLRRQLQETKVSQKEKGL